MKPADVEAKSVALKDEARTLAATICAATIDEKSSEILKLALRRRMVEEISRIAQDLDQQARRKEEEIRSYSIHKGKEVWVYFFLTDKGTARYEATLMGRESGLLTVLHLRQKYSTIRHMRHPSFVEAIKELEQDILNGNYDERLGTGPSRVIYDALKDRAM